MRCLKEADLMRFVDGSMPNAAHEAVQRHVHGCVRCAGELQRLTAIGSRIDAWLAILAPEDAIPIDAPESLARLRGRIQERPTPARKWALVWAAAVASACIVVIAIGIHGHQSVITSRAKPDMHATTTEFPQAPLGQLPSVSTRPVRAAHGRPRPDRPQATADYLPLDSGVPMQMGVIVRVTLPAATFARFGASGSGNLQADVLVGEDGIAHAIRLVPRK
jgi:anti-sigma factor RsiW